MSPSNPKVHAALGIACLALALAIYAVIRGPSSAQATGANACVDQEARDQADQLRRALADRDAYIARLARAVNATGGAAAAGEPPQRVAPPDPGARRFTHFETANPAVTVTQKADGSYDIRTTDPSLAGTTMQITAITDSGEAEKVMIRIPQ